MSTVTIVTISYNQAAYLERALLSVINQGCRKDIQYIVVDAGSTDASRAIIDAHRNDIDVVIYEPDEGPADGLNKGFARATGNILAFVNADDMLLQGAVAKACRFLDAHQDIDVVSAHGVAIDASDRKIRRVFSDNFYLRGCAFGTSILVQQSTFFRRELFEMTGGFNIANRCAWDGELFVAMAEQGARFAVVRDLWSAFRIHPEGITGSRRMEEMLRSYRHGMFKRIIGREQRAGDILEMGLHRAWKHARNVSGLIERARLGRVSPRGSQERKSGVHT
jgi:glycosyltransferase involved in cell wall biosynthesis